MVVLSKLNYEQFIIGAFSISREKLKSPITWKQNSVDQHENSIFNENFLTHCLEIQLDRSGDRVWPINRLAGRETN